MSPCELERAVARATRETRREIRQRGFQPVYVGSEEPATDDDLRVVVVDWDALEAERPTLFP